MRKIGVDHNSQAPGFNANAQAHQAPWPGPGTVTKEQDAHLASAALLKGEEKWMPSMSSKQTAAPGTPSISNTPISPALSPEATPSPSEPAPGLNVSPSPVGLAENAQQERVPSSSCTDTAADPQPSGNGLAHLGTNAPCPAPSLHCTGAFTKDPGDSWGVPMVENGVPAPHTDPDNTASTFAVKNAHIDAPAHCMPAEAKHSHDWPPWEEPTESPVTCKVCTATQGLSQMGNINIDNPNQSDHRGRIVHPPQLVCINSMFPCHQLANSKLFSMPTDHQVPLSINHTPDSTAENHIITHDMPHCRAVITFTWAMLAMRPDTISSNANCRAKLGHMFPIDGGTMAPFSR